MLCFIIPFKSRTVCRDWGKECGVFEKALFSAYNQIDPDFRIIVVCHEKPHLERSYDKRVEFISVDFIPPKRSEYLSKEYVGMHDKGRKKVVGISRASKLKPDFIMLMDSDDFVHRKLSYYANANKDANGWVIKIGYTYDCATGKLFLIAGFNLVCGSSCIINARLLKYTKNINQIKKRNVLVKPHAEIEPYLLAQGIPLQVLPFPGAIYVLGHGGNWSHVARSIRQKSDNPWRKKLLPGNRLISKAGQTPHILNLGIRLFSYKLVPKDIKDDFSIN